MSVHPSHLMHFSCVRWAGLALQRPLCRDLGAPGALQWNCAGAAVREWDLTCHSPALEEIPCTKASPGAMVGETWKQPALSG